MTLTRRIMQGTRERFHPLFHARKSKTGRRIIHLLDKPVWMQLPDVAFKVRGRRVTHGLAFGAVGSQEKNAEALTLACLRHCEIRSFWDVGANVGYYSWLALSASPGIEVVLLEPLPDNYALINDTLKRNQFPNVRLIAAGASDKTGTGILHADSEAGATSSLESEADTFEERHFGVKPKLMNIPLVSIDDERYNPIDFIKIDVEGHEESVLRGAAKTISSDQPILFIECGHPGHPCLSSLEGYSFIDADRLGKCDASTLNYFCFPRRLAGSINDFLVSARK